MFEHAKLQQLSDYFLELNQRPVKGIYFYRINCYNKEIEKFIQKYYEQARRSGAVIEGRIPNPDEKNLAYYEEIMGTDFMMNVGFFMSALKKWLPRMDDYQRKTVAEAIYDTLDEMRNAGKNDNILKNAYIKFMCWLYYKFERVVSLMGKTEIPKILYEGSVSNYELKLICVLSRAGCDVVLLQREGDAAYLKLDPQSLQSEEYCCEERKPFPQGFSLNDVRRKMEEEMNLKRLYGPLPAKENCTNAWISGKGLEDIAVAPGLRGNDERLYYNCFIRITGVEDKLTYQNELYQLFQQMKAEKRRVVVVNKMIAPPTTDEIAAVKRHPYQKRDQMLLDLLQNIRYISNLEVQKMISKAFIDVLVQSDSDGNVNKLTNKAVYLLCWIKRYYTQLFGGYQSSDVSIFISLGGCKNENEALFLKFLSKLPVDVLILIPDLNDRCCLKDENLYEIHYPISLVLEQFPVENVQIQVGTAAYHAERELDEIMYQDSGMYRNRQYQRANVLTLQTMYEEIAILWDQELKYRPNFSVVDNVVNIPVIFAKVSGVKDGDTAKYWSEITKMKTEDTFIIKEAPFIDSTQTNPVKQYAVEFFKNKKLQQNKIKNHNCYQYGYLREECQDYILDKLQMLIDGKIIKGTYENGTEYTIIATVLNLNKEIVRMIQSFDFTKKNPKLIYFHTTEAQMSLEDSILLAFLNMVGFDIVLFVPTGYQDVEKYYNKKVMEEHQIGNYMYDLRVPDLNSSNTLRSWRKKIFKRGN